VACGRNEEIAVRVRLALASLIVAAFVAADTQPALTFTAEQDSS
jgi:hypothetical protein